MDRRAPVEFPPTPVGDTTVPAGQPTQDQPRGEKLARLRNRSHRHRHQLPPWRALTLIPAALLLHLAPWPPMFIRLFALMGVGALTWWLKRRARTRWDERLYADLCVTTATLWTLYTVRCGLWGNPGRYSLLVFLAGWVPLSWLWWERHHVRAHTPDDPDPDVDPFAAQWGLLVQPELGWTVSSPERVDAGHAYRVHLTPGQTIEDAENARRKIASLLRMSRRRLVFEQSPGEVPGDTDDESVIRLLVLDKDNPQHQRQEWEGPTLDKTTGLYRHGVYPDGPAFLSLFQTEDGIPHRARNGLWCGATGKGKSRGLAIKIAEHLKSGMFSVWYADGKGGASAPELEGRVDWYADTLDETTRMLRAAWKIMKARTKAIKRMYQEAFRGRQIIHLGSKVFPFLQIILDEAQEFLVSKTVARVVKALLRMGNEVGIGVDLSTQVPLLSELGSASGDTGIEVIRSMAKAGNMAIYKTEDTFTGRVTLGDGIEFDPKTLPDLPGACRINGNHGRSAWCKTYYVSKTELWGWLTDIPAVTLDVPSARAAGDDYVNRHQRATDNDVPPDRIDLDDLDAELAILLGERLPGQPAPGSAEKTLTIKQAVFEVVKDHDGPIKRDEFDAALAARGVTASKSSIDQTLRWWCDRGHVENTSHGHYDLVVREEPANA